MPGRDDEGRHDDPTGGDHLAALRGDVGRLDDEVGRLAAALDGLHRELDVLGRIVGRLTRQVAAPGEVVVRRLTVVDVQGTPRMVAEVVAGTMELRLELPGTTPGHRSAVVLHASPATPATLAGPDDDPAVAALLGLQLWADGDAVAELDAWPDEAGRWRPHLHLGDD